MTDFDDGATAKARYFLKVHDPIEYHNSLEVNVDAPPIPLWGSGGTPSLVAAVDGPLTLQQAGNHTITQGSGKGYEWSVGGSVDLSVASIGKVLGLGEFSGSYGGSVTLEATQEKTLDFALDEDYYTYGEVVIGYLRKFTYFRHYTPAGEHRLNTDYGHRVWKDTPSVAKLQWCRPRLKDVDPYPSYNPSAQPPLPPPPDGDEEIGD